MSTCSEEGLRALAASNSRMQGLKELYLAYVGFHEFTADVANAFLDGTEKDEILQVLEIEANYDLYSYYADDTAYDNSGNDIALNIEEINHFLDLNHAGRRLFSMKNFPLFLPPRVLRQANPYGIFRYFRFWIRSAVDTGKSVHLLPPSNPCWHGR